LRHLRGGLGGGENLQSNARRSNVTGCERAGAAGSAPPEARLLEHLSIVREGDRSGAQRGIVGHHAAQRCLQISGRWARARLDVICCAATKSAQAGTGAARKSQSAWPSEVAPFDGPWASGEVETAPRTMSRVPNGTPASSHGAASSGLSAMLPNACSAGMLACQLIFLSIVPLHPLFTACYAREMFVKCSRNVRNASRESRETFAKRPRNVARNTSPSCCRGPQRPPRLLCD
jgi:hypothetical protein